MTEIDLDKLSSNELGKLFPIKISNYNPDWGKLFEIEKNELIKILGTKVVLKIEHFGSTAVPDLASKPTIDILIEIPENENVKKGIIQKMKREGYHYILRNDCPPPYIMFVKGYTTKGIIGQSYHIHMAEKEHNGLWDRIYFRDYLIHHIEKAKQYEILKRKLAGEFRYDREAYTNGKTEFILKITKIAKQEYLDTLKEENR